MKITELISKLAALMEAGGDMEIKIDDADTGWHLEIERVTTEEGVVLIGGDYRGSEE